MAEITWQNVAAPQFDPGANLSRAGDLFNTALGNLGAGVNAVDQGKTNEIAANIRAALATAPSADIAQQMIQSGRVAGYNLTDPGVAQRINPQDLLDQVTGRIKAQGDLTNYDQRVANDANTPLYAQARGMVAAGKSAPEVQAFLDQHPEAFKGIGAANLNSFLNDVTTQQTNDLANTRTAFDTELAKRNDAVNSQAQELAQKAMLGGTTPEERTNLLENALLKLQGQPNFGLISARARELLTGGAGMGASGTSGAGGSMDTSLGGGSGGGVGAAALGLMSGGGRLPDNIKTVGDFVDNKDALLKGSKANSTATGIYQINSGTAAEFGPQALGADWRNANFQDFSTQDKLGAAIFKDATSKADPVAALRGRWDSLKNLSDADVKQIAAMPWNQASQIIAQKESGVPNLAVLQGNAVAAQAASQVEAGRQDPTNISSRLIAAAANRDLAGTTAKMVKTFGMTEQDANFALQHIIDRAKALTSKDNPQGINLTPGQAYEIFTDSRRGENIGDWLTGWANAGNRAGANMRTRNNVIDQEIQTFASPQALTQAVRDAERGRQQQLNAGNLQGAQAAYNNYLRAYNDSINRPGYAPELLDRAKAQFVRAAQIAGISSSDLIKFTNPQYFGDKTLLSKLQVGNDGPPPAQAAAAAVAAAAKPKPAPPPAPVHTAPRVSPVLASVAPAAQGGPEVQDLASLLHGVQQWGANRRAQYQAENKAAAAELALRQRVGIRR